MNPNASSPQASGDSGRQRHELIAPADAGGVRLDVFWARALPGVSRSRVGRSIDAGGARVDGKLRKASYRLVGGERIVLELVSEPAGALPESIPLDVLYEDAALAVVNKPPGMVVHPAKGHWAGTLASAVAAHFQQLSAVGGAVRPGIVHRLDRDTSGAMVIAKTDAAHHALAAQFQARQVRKEYLAIVAGVPDRDRDRIEHAIGPHPTQREKKALRTDHPQSRAAETHYEVLERFHGFALVRAEPKTGRTHQIRLHLAHVGLPVLCDKLYGGRATLTLGQLRHIALSRKWTEGARNDEIVLARQALHAHRLGFDHPCTHLPVVIEAPLSSDMERLLMRLRQAASER